MSHVRLACIARNEAKSLPELAEKVRPLINSWVICLDPRTNDDTENVAYEVFKGIPGKVVYSELDDETFSFAAARNELHEHAKKFGAYLLMLDCDSPCIGKLPKKLTKPVYVCDVRDEHGWSWKVPFLVKSDAINGWKMPAHEYLDIECKPEDISFLKDIYIERKGAGTNEARKLWTVDVLTKEAESDSEDAGRAAFFLANTLHSLGETEKALEWYMRRVGMPGMPEETFFSMYRVGRLLHPTNQMKASRAYLDAFGLRPWRSEPLFFLSEIANQFGNHQMALAFANQGLSNPPTTDGQFVERWIEEWGMRLQWSLAAFYCGVPESVEVMKDLLKREDIPDYYRLALEHFSTKPVPTSLPSQGNENPEPTGEPMTTEGLPNWFAMYADKYFEALLKPLAGTEGLRALQLGCFAGDASAWLLEHIVTGYAARLDDVDTWEGSEDIHDIDFRDVEARYDKQTSPFDVHVAKHKMTSTAFLDSLPREPIYDFIYIDGDHTSVGTLADAVNSFDRLKVGGILAFDDYKWRGDVRPLHCPYPAIDAFLVLYAERIQHLVVDAQVWLKRIA